MAQHFVYADFFGMNREPDTGAERGGRCRQRCHWRPLQGAQDVHQAVIHTASGCACPQDKMEQQL